MAASSPSSLSIIYKYHHNDHQFYHHHHHHYPPHHDHLHRLPPCMMMKKAITVDISLYYHLIQRYIIILPSHTKIYHYTAFSYKDISLYYHLIQRYIMILPSHTIYCYTISNLINDDDDINFSIHPSIPSTHPSHLLDGHESLSHYSRVVLD